MERFLQGTPIFSNLPDDACRQSRHSKSTGSTLLDVRSKSRLHPCCRVPCHCRHSTVRRSPVCALRISLKRLFAFHNANTLRVCLKSIRNLVCESAGRSEFFCRPPQMQSLKPDAWQARKLVAFQWKDFPIMNRFNRVAGVHKGVFSYYFVIILVIRLRCR